jgi:UDPglucose 6-dehydrogenase
MGKLGAPVAACFASSGFRVIGVDQDRHKVEAINRGKPPIHEPGLEELMASTRKSLSATQNIHEAVLQSSVTFVIVPTLPKPEQGYALDHILPACESIARALVSKDEFHLIVVSSTVMPGSTEGILKKRVEELSGGLSGHKFGLCYNPEFMAIGSVIHDFLNPDFVLIGESDTRSGDRLEGIYREILGDKSKIVRMNPVNAELTKLALNCFVTTKITFFNQLAQFCELLPRANVDVVTSAVGLDSRIGPKCLKGGLGYGGPCFPYDNRAMISLSHRLGIEVPLSEVTDLTNRSEVARIMTIVKNNLPEEGVAGILGLAYKPETNVIEGSQGFFLAETLASLGIPVIAYDPQAADSAKKKTQFPIQFVDSAQECLKDADVVVLATPWNEFRHLKVNEVYEKRPLVIIDCWRILKPDKLNNQIKYIAIGIGPSTTE